MKKRPATRPRRQSDTTVRREPTPPPSDAGQELSEAGSSSIVENSSEPSTARPRAKLAVLVYLCGDNHIGEFTDKYWQSMLAATPLEHIHLIVQHDKPLEAKRFIVRAGTKKVDNSQNVRRDVNTGAPDSLAEFLAWALTAKEALADHYVLIFSGLGINPRYVRQSLPLEALPRPLQKARGGKPKDPNDPDETKEFVEKFVLLDEEERSEYRDAIHSRAFSICHDFSNSGSLQFSDLRDVLADSVKWFAESKSDARFDLVFFQTGATAFVECLFELEGLAQVFMGSSGRLPDEGLPFNAIFANWDKELSEYSPSQRGRRRTAAVSKILAKDCLSTLARATIDPLFRQSFSDAKPKKIKEIQDSLDEIVAVNIDALDELARSLDALAIALMHSLGDWHVKDALEQAQREYEESHARAKQRNSRGRDGNGRISADEPGKPSNANPILDDIEFLPAVDLFEWLDKVEAAFAQKLMAKTELVKAEEPADGDGAAPSDAEAVSDEQDTKTSVAKKRSSAEHESSAAGASQEIVPQAYGQRERIRKIYKLIRKTIAHLHSSKLSQSETMPGRLFIDKDNDVDYGGLMVVMPPLRTQAEIDTGKRQYSIATPSYSQLNFSRRVHWAALVGTYQMIREKPHTLWRVISSMLVDASSPARDAVLSRLISRQSVISQMRGQFRSLGESESLSMSFDELENGNRDSDLTRFQVRLEPSLGGSIIFQHESRIYRSTLDSIWNDLSELMQLNEPSQALVQKLRSLGASLGEDVIQDLVGALEMARQSMAEERNETPHLTLQLPREFMRYPWELMNDREGLLSERYALGRQVFMDSRFTRSTIRRQANKIRVLVIGAPVPSRNFQIFGTSWKPEPLPGAIVEANTIVKAFDRLNDEMAGIVEFEVMQLIDKQVVRDELRRHLRDGRFDIIHFAGHALYNTVDGDGSGWVVSDGLLHAREIRNTLAWSKRPPWLIFANACEAGMDISHRQANTDVSGLATACISNGVAAFIAPLWPVDDEIARWLAVSFYRELLRERFSVGESLRKARLAIWDNLKESGSTTAMPASTALTWASFVLYGDPTSRLLNTLWNPDSDQKAAATVSKPGKRTAVRPTAARFRTATAGQLCSAVDFPAALQVSTTDLQFGLTRGQRTDVPCTQEQLKASSFELQLVEREGLRYWSVVGNDHDRPSIQLSKLGRLLNDKSEATAKVRDRIGSRIGQDRGVMDYVRVVKRWAIKKVQGVPTDSLIKDLVTEFDRQQVTDERLLRYTTAKDTRTILGLDGGRKTDRSNREDNKEWLKRQVGHGQLDRALLILHGTTSRSSYLIDDFAKRLEPNIAGQKEDETLMNWMLRRYRGVLAYDHWTLSKSPEVNAEDLIALLPKTCRNADGHIAPLELDIICHDRGGLVARYLVEKANREFNVNRVVFVGTPHAGTSIASPNRWGAMADVLINQISHDPTGVLCRLSSFFAYMCTQKILDNVPGIDAMRPLPLDQEAVDPKHLLEILKVVPKEIVEKYFVVASNYAPSRDSLSLQSVLSEASDQLVDKFFDQANDLLVETASMWALDQRPDWKGPPTAIPAENILLFNTEHDGPKGIAAEQRSGIHHLNYFQHWRVREFIRHVLDEVT